MRDRFDDSVISARRTTLLAHDPQFSAACPDDAITTAIRQPSMPLKDILTTIMAGYADRPALGERATESVLDPVTGRTTRRLLPRFDTISYDELWRRANAIAAAWYHDELAPVRAGDFVAILGFTSGDYATLDLACLRANAVTVPLQAGSAPAQLLPVVHETRPRILATSVEHLLTAAEIAASAPSVRRLVVFDHHSDVDDEWERIEEVRHRLGESGHDVVVESLPEVLDRGAALPSPPETDSATDSATDSDEERLSLLIYTSGTTGMPKGAMYPARLVAELWRGFFPERPGLPLIDVAYLPMSHLAGRAVLYSTLARGGTSFFTARTDLSVLFEDLALVRPAVLMLVPRLCETLFQQYHPNPAADGTGQAVSSRLGEQVFGDRYLWAVCGAAPLSAELTEFMESMLGMRLPDGYASTEVGAALFDGKVMRERVLDHRLEDVPELNYFTTDSPYPRGELLLRSNSVIPGYYRRPDLSAEVFTDDGFYRTGDIMARTGPDELIFVDRRNNLLKLSQGEFVALSRLETLFTGSPMIRQIYLYGTGEHGYLLAVVVPAPEALDGDDPERLTSLIHQALQQVGRANNLAGYEIPRDFLIETEPFSPENGLLSGIRKLLRPKLKERYVRELERRYAEIAEREASALQQLQEIGSDQPVIDTVLAAAQAVLSTSTGHRTPGEHFLDLGGDSLSALTLATLLRDIFSVDVPVGVIVSPATDLGALAAYLEQKLTSGAADQPSVADVHGPAVTELHAAELTLDKFLDPKTLNTARNLPHPDGPLRTILLTGATGYLGRFLCLEWLRRLQSTGGTLVCLVRGSDNAAARARLDAAFASDEELSRQYHALADTRLEVLAADLSEPHFGLTPESWRHLADTTDLIVHDGALVNHVLPYAQLFGPNVVGTAEVIRLALTAKLKPVTYVSTIGVLTDDSAEDADLRRASPIWTLDDGYANGYSGSKWVGEVLLREAHDLCGLPVTTLRSGMILAHSRYAGQLNVSDVFTRLLLSLLITGIAPNSFYRAGAAAHHGGLPVDFTAEAVVSLGAEASADYRTYHVVDSHDDGISLDTYIDWLGEAGHPVTRVGDYRTWLPRFETALRALPESQKRHSLLPLLHAFADPQTDSAIPAERFRTALHRTSPGRPIPHVTAELIGKYVTDLARLGLL
ncbi:fatty acid CoA ligase FadD9 [Amycolatopsis sulphurea]|uniref:Fatty acid CoA ligase FadD9 n=1 Tax=Amycolatopsis sulphurea TaxID=76022 RepID=A0A2A9FBQ2_9PSEU|nr:carboxylic acid reductase [Amycolatopsis sulphurea]PFG48598.1 fatty acid CoA ligase FadD9 [Amycolatopsis sulphurea]